MVTPIKKTPLFLLMIILLLAPSISAQSQTCSTYSFSSNKIYATCTDLPVLDSFLHWNYHQSNGTVEIAYRHTGVTTTTWVAWALNPTRSGMIGSQALVALHNSSGATAYTSSVDSLGTSLARSDLSFQVPSVSAEYVNSEMIIHATLVLPSGRTSFTQVWQAGSVAGGIPQAHPQGGAPNMRAVGTVDFATGQVASGGGGAASQQRKRNVHGVLNAVAWGTLLPIGAMTARYLKVFKSADPAWFYLHVACQTSAYAVGVAGWATGLKLGSDSAGITHKTHRAMGIALFCLGTLQVFALLLRPNKDHKFRIYWNIYHWSIGYGVIVLSIVNVYEGLDILQPGKDWKRAYTIVLIVLGAITAVLEAYTWFVVLKRKRTGGDKHTRVANGANGHASRSQV